MDMYTNFLECDAACAAAMLQTLKSSGGTSCTETVDVQYETYERGSAIEG
jgi:hypothetical protein